MFNFLVLPLLATAMGFEIIEYQKTQLGDIVDKASMKMLKETFEAAENKNVVTSPLGALTLLAMLSKGTEGASRDEIMQLLGSGDFKQLTDSYSNLTGRFSSMDSSYLVLANKIYVSDMYTLDEDFSDVARRSYNSEVEQLDFAQQKLAAEAINKWADEKTKGHIKDPVNEDMIDGDTAVALFNVIFFQGHWYIKFDESVTEDKNFYVDESTTVTKPMMKYTGSLFYYENADLGASMVELPYKEQGFRMVVVLPDQKQGLAGVVEKLAQRGILYYASQLSPSGRQIALELPKFKINSKLNLNQILPKVGVSSIFRQGAPGVVRERAVTVSRIFQEAFIKVDEEGSTAGAFTGAIAVPTSSNYVLPPPKPFKVDHPFLFAIIHEDILLFTGTYTQ